MTSTVRVYCNAPSHDTKTAEIDTFERVDEGWRVVQRPQRADPIKRGMTGADWQEKAPRKLSAPSRERFSNGRVFTGLLAERDLPGLTAEQRAEIGHDSGGHFRYRLRCPLCGLDVQISEQKWFVRLDRLAEHGVSDISLGDLAARLSGS